MFDMFFDNFSKKSVKQIFQKKKSGHGYISVKSFKTEGMDATFEKKFENAELDKKIKLQ